MEQETPQVQPKKRKWTRRRSPKFKLPQRVPRPVSALWESASPEQKQKAHEAAVAILENWMGKASQVEIAQRLGVPPLRVWQMSRQALGGLVAGLLKQPKVKRGANPEGLPPEEDPKALKKRIATLERDLGMMKDLVGLLKEFPANREARQVPEGEARSGKKKKPEMSPGIGPKDGGLAGDRGPHHPSGPSRPTDGGE